MGMDSRPVEKTALLIFLLGCARDLKRFEAPDEPAFLGDASGIYISSNKSQA